MSLGRFVLRLTFSAAQVGLTNWQLAPIRLGAAVAYELTTYELWTAYWTQRR